MGRLQLLARCFAALVVCAAPARTQVSAPNPTLGTPLQGAPGLATPPLAAQLPAPSVHMRVRRGWARQHTPAGDQWALAGAANAQGLLQGRTTVGLRGRLELTAPATWRAVIDGPAEAEVPQRPGRADLELGSFDRVLLDVTRECRVRLPQGQQLRLLRGLVELRRNPDGSVAFTHHGGQPVEVDLGGRFTFLWQAGTRRAVPPRLTPEPARRGGARLAPGTYRTFPQRMDGTVNQARLPEPDESLLESLWPF